MYAEHHQNNPHQALTRHQATVPLDLDRERGAQQDHCRYHSGTQHHHLFSTQILAVLSREAVTSW